MVAEMDLSMKLSRDTVTSAVRSVASMSNSAKPCESVLDLPRGPCTVAPATLDPKVSLTLTLSTLNANGVAPLPPPPPPQAERHRQSATTTNKADQPRPDPPPATVEPREV